MAGHCRHHWPGCRLAGRRIGDLPGGQAHLDAQLDAIQRRVVSAVAGGVLSRDRSVGTAALGFSAGRDWHELHCCVLDGPLIRELGLQRSHHSSRSEHLQNLRRCLRTTGARRGGAGGSLANALLDVSPKNLSAHLISCVSGEKLRASTLKPQGNSKSQNPESLSEQTPELNPCKDRPPFP